MLEFGLYYRLYLCVFFEDYIGLLDIGDACSDFSRGYSSFKPFLLCEACAKEKANEFFGFYNIFGKFASVMGPLLVGVTAQLTGSSSYGVFSLVILFIIGGIVLKFVPEPEMKVS